MNTYHVVTHDGETRVEGEFYTCREGMFGIGNIGEDGEELGAFVCPISSLVYAKVIERKPSPKPTVQMSVSVSAEQLARAIERNKADAYFHTA